MEARGVLKRDDVFALTSGIAEFGDRRGGIFQETGAIGRVGPCASNDAGAVARADLGLVSFDQEIERGRIDITFFGQNRLEGAHAQLGLRQFRMVVIVVMIRAGHNLTIGAIFRRCRGAMGSFCPAVEGCQG